jgi:hypothetical protein
MQPFRLDPAGPVGAYKTYAVTSPTDTTVVAACEHVDCAARRHGWRSLIDETIDLGRRQAAYIRGPARRTYTERPGPGGLTEFLFEPGQRCFAEHRTRPEIYVVRGGDWRGNPTGEIRQHVRAADWVDDFGEHQQRLADQIERG